MTGPAEARVFIALCEWHIVPCPEANQRPAGNCALSKTRFHRWSATIGMRRDAEPAHRQ